MCVVEKIDKSRIIIEVVIEIKEWQLTEQLFHQLLVLCGVAVVTAAIFRVAAEGRGAIPGLPSLQCR